jgi:outer membrane protein OmpA-like peptidoglycan-associated protein
MHLGIRIGIAVVALATPTLLVQGWVSSAEQRLATVESELAGAETPEVAVAAAANAEYCNANLKKVLRRVLLSCGLSDNANARGCQPVDAKNVATMAGEDFNALFLPLSDRASIIQFEKNAAELEPEDLELLDATFADQRGASWFFVVARSSPEGQVEHNRELSQARAEAVMGHLRAKFDDPDLDKEVGLLWLGEEFAQLDQGFCDWRRSGDANQCEPDHINRSAFVAWIDCRL